MRSACDLLHVYEFQREQGICSNDGTTVSDEYKKIKLYIEMKLIPDLFTRFTRMPTVHTVIDFIQLNTQFVAFHTFLR